MYGSDYIHTVILDNQDMVALLSAIQFYLLKLPAAYVPSPHLKRELFSSIPVLLVCPLVRKGIISC